MTATAIPTPAVQVVDLEHLYGGEVPALCGVSLVIERGEFVAVIGQNGSGKTTLVKHFNGLLRPTRGKVYVGGLDTANMNVGQLSKFIGYVFQNPDHQIFCPSVWEEVSFGPKNLGLSPAEIKERTEEAITLFGLAGYASHPPAVLGFGLRRKVSLAAIYSMRPEIMLLDEPTTGLDWRSSVELMQIVTELNRKGHTIILVTHDMRVVAEYTRRSIVLKDGQIILDGPTHEVLVDFKTLRETQISPPQITQLSEKMVGTYLSNYALTVEEFYNNYTEMSLAKHVPIFEQANTGYSPANPGPNFVPQGVIAG